MFAWLCLYRRKSDFIPRIKSTVIINVSIQLTNFFINYFYEFSRENKEHKLYSFHLFRIYLNQSNFFNNSLKCYQTFIRFN